MGSRRHFLKVGFGLVVPGIAGTALRHASLAARRGTSGPQLPSASGSVGYTFEIRANRDDIDVVALPGRGPTDFSVTILNRTSYEFKVDVILGGYVITDPRILGNSTAYFIFQEEGLYLFRLVRGEAESADMGSQNSWCVVTRSLTTSCLVAVWRSDAPDGTSLPGPLTNYR